MSIEQDKTTSAATTDAGSIKLLTKKTPGFRIVQADGAWGGLNGYGIIHMQFFSEHPAIPSAVNMLVSKDGKSFESMKPEGEEQHRDFEVDVVMTLPSAIQVHTVLGNFIKLAEQQLKDQTEAKK